MDLIPNTDVPPSKGPPVVAEARPFERPKRPDAPSINLHDVPLVAGSTAYLPSDTGIGSGDLPAPWNAPVADADRTVGANRVEEAGFRIILRDAG